MHEDRVLAPWPVKSRRRHRWAISAIGAGTAVGVTLGLTALTAMPTGTITFGLAAAAALLAAYTAALLTHLVEFRRRRSEQFRATRLVRQLIGGELRLQEWGGRNTSDCDLTAEWAALSETIQTERDLRSQLARDVAHEFRTPLSVLRSHTEAIQDGVWAPTEARMEVFSQEISRLIGLVEDLDYLADAELKVLSLNCTTVPVRAFLDTLAEGFEPVFARKLLAFRYDPPPDALRVVVDRDKIGRAVINLLSNAYKYTPVGGAVALAAWQEGNEVSIAVADTGGGIESGDRERIFDRSFRASSGRQASGKGLGLTIARTLAEAHGGRIEVWTEPGKGSEFTLVLPVAPFAAAAGG